MPTPRAARAELSERFDIVVVGAGAAGLMAAIQAARAEPTRSILLLDGARKPGAKILVAGGGRCNVTHHAVEAGDFCGSTAPAIRKVLRRFDVERTVAFFSELGVELKREAGGKLFPVSDRAQSVLRALTDEVERRGIDFRYPRRVERIEPGFAVVGNWGRVEAGAVVVATGGRALPRSGSDGHGYRMVRALGLPLNEPIFPALVPLALPPGDALLELSGISAPVRLELRSASGKRELAVEGALLCTHRGISGPAVLDVSRHLIAGAHRRLFVDWLPGRDLEASLRALGRGSVRRHLAEQLPQRLARTLCARVGVEAEATGDRLTRETRRRLVRTVHEHELPIAGDLGFTKAEVTAGGVPLAALRLESLEARDVPGLYLCGEICDVDGRIGGFNFQWAWASGTVAGRAVAAQQP